MSTMKSWRKFLLDSRNPDSQTKQLCWLDANLKTGRKVNLETGLVRSPSSREQLVDQAFEEIPGRRGYFHVNFVNTEESKVEHIDKCKVSGTENMTVIKNTGSDDERESTESDDESSVYAVEEVRNTD